MAFGEVLGFDVVVDYHLLLSEETAPELCPSP